MQYLFVYNCSWLKDKDSNGNKKERDGMLNEDLRRYGNLVTARGDHVIADDRCCDRC